MTGNKLRLYNRPCVGVDMVLVVDKQFCSLDISVLPVTLRRLGVIMDCTNSFPTPPDIQWSIVLVCTWKEKKTIWGVYQLKLFSSSVFFLQMQNSYDGCYGSSIEPCFPFLQHLKPYTCPFSFFYGIVTHCRGGTSWSGSLQHIND